MVIITKEFKGSDNKMRSWTIDTEDNVIKYNGFASDFQNKVFSIGKTEVTNSFQDSTAQELIDSITREEI